MNECTLLSSMSSKRSQELACLLPESGEIYLVPHHLSQGLFTRNRDSTFPAQAGPRMTPNPRWKKFAGEPLSSREPVFLI